MQNGVIWRCCDNMWCNNVVASDDANQEKDNNTFYWCELAMIISILALM
jgi:hypothetical protein